MVERDTKTPHLGKMPPEKGTRASPQTNDEKAQEMLEKAKSEPKPDWDVAEQVVLIPLEQLKPFKNHPYRVDDNDELMQDTIDSILAGGVINPILVRPSDDGKFEIVSGHRRARASAFACKPTIKAIVREMDDDTAVITMVDSNLQRENLLPSEKAKAYRMKMDAMARKLGRPKKECQLGTKYSGNKTAQILANQIGESCRQVQRYIRLTELSPDLLTMVDNKQIAFNPAVELSYLKEQEQRDFQEAMDFSQTAPSLSQAQRIKKLSQGGRCTREAMCEILSEEKKPEVDRLTIAGDVLRKFFPRNYTPMQMQQTIIKLLEVWHKKRTRDMER